MRKRPVASVMKTLAPFRSGQSDCVRASTAATSSAMIGWVGIGKAICGQETVTG